MAHKARILIVEDDRDVREACAEYFASHGFEVEAVENGDAMRAAVARRVPELVMLDLRLPGEDGLSLARWLRAHHAVGIVMVTAADEVVDRVVGLEVGADDYVAKPYDLRELLARVKSVLRRTRGGEAREPAEERRVRIGRFQLDLASHRLVDERGEDVELTSMEFDLLRVFSEHPNQVLSRDQLLNKTRNRDWEPFDRSIDIRIARLRRKIEADPERPRLLKTVRGAGYLYVPERR